jgi:hypothetical protein
MRYAIKQGDKFLGNIDADSHTDAIDKAIKNFYDPVDAEDVTAELVSEVGEEFHHQSRD